MMSTMGARHAVLIFGCVLVCGLALGLYWPALDFGLFGDDFQLVQRAADASVHPELLLVPFGNISRPAFLFTLMVDRQIWDMQAFGYHLTNLLFLAAVATALTCAGFRLGLSTCAALAVACVWVTSIYGQEPAVWVSARPDLMLAGSWLAMIALWPSRGQQWSMRRAVPIVLLLGLSMASKETWIGSPLVVVPLELHRTRWRWRPALPAFVAISVAVGAYLAVRVAQGAGPAAAGAGLTSVIGKIPNLLATFFYLEELAPAGFSLKWTGLLASAIVAALAVDSWRSRDATGITGLALMIGALLPVVAVPYLPHRYTLIPYAGFLLLVSSWAARNMARLTTKRQLRATVAMVAILVCLVMAAGARQVRVDLVDWKRVSLANQRLLAEIDEVLPEIAQNRPLAVVRLEHSSPLEEIARSPAGGWKLLWPRPSGLYGVASTAAAFDWALGDLDVAVREVADRERGAGGDVLGHSDGRFLWLARQVPNLDTTLQPWKRAGHPTTVLCFVPRSEDSGPSPATRGASPRP